VPSNSTLAATQSPWTPFESAYRVNLSLERLRRYRKDRDKGAWAPMIGRYLYNVELASVLLPTLGWAEVVLRNRLHRVIGRTYPIDGERSFQRVRSWLDADPPILLPREQERVRQAKSDFDRRNPAPRRASDSPAKVLTEGRLIAELRFGFWTRLLDGVYADWRVPGNPLFWPRLLEEAFPNCTPSNRTRKHVQTRFTEIKEVRNRAFHHERISHLVDVAMYDRMLEAIEWIDPVIAEGLRERERTRFLTVVTAGAQPYIEWAQQRAATSAEIIETP
jgi:hypothetical protein